MKFINVLCKGFIVITVLLSSVAFSAQQPFYRAYSGSAGDHFYTTSFNELLSAVGIGYGYEGVACDLVTADDARNGGALYRAYSASQGDHFYTKSYPEFINAISSLGYVSEGVSGYMTTSGSNLWRSYSGSQGDHFYTKSYSEWLGSATNFGYLLEGSSGTVL